MPRKKNRPIAPAGTKYPHECVLDLFQKLKRGMSWKNITKQLNHKYGFINDHTHYRNLYHRYKDRLDTGPDGKLTLDMIRQAAQARHVNRTTNKKLNKVLKEMDIRDHLVQDFEALVKKYSKARTVVKRAKKNSLKPGRAEMTLALDISDVHAGLETRNYNEKKLRARLKTLVTTFLHEYDRNSATHSVTELIISFNGDMIHNDKLHEDSIKACSEGVPGQLYTVTDVLFSEVVEPIAHIGLPTRIIGTAGNHDRTTAGRSMFKQGREGYTWTCYKTLELLSIKLGYDNLEFIIPEGYGTVVNIQGSNILYEHGDMIKGNTEKSLIDHMNKRAAQLETILQGMRIGHFHEFKQIGRRIIVNGSITCGDDYSQSLGYDTEPVQTIVTYCKSKHRKNSLYRVFPVLLPK